MMPPNSPHARACKIRETLASGYKPREVAPMLRELTALAEQVFDDARRNLRQSGDAQLASTIESGALVVDMLRRAQDTLATASPSYVLAVVSFVEQALGMQELYGPGPAGAAAGVVAPRSATRGRALLVEDEEAFLRVAGNWLREAGFDVMEVTRADVARPLLVEESWDLLFADLNLPGGGDGFNLADHALASNIGIAVVFATGYSSRVRPEALASWPLLRKPFKRSDLEAAVEKAMRMTARHASVA